MNASRLLKLNFNLFEFIHLCVTERKYFCAEILWIWILNVRSDFFQLWCTLCEVEKLHRYVCYCKDERSTWRYDLCGNSFPLLVQFSYILECIFSKIVSRKVAFTGNLTWDYPFLWIVVNNNIFQYHSIAFIRATKLLITQILSTLIKA